MSEYRCERDGEIAVLSGEELHLLTLQESREERGHGREDGAEVDGTARGGGPVDLSSRGRHSALAALLLVAAVSTEEVLKAAEYITAELSDVSERSERDRSAQCLRVNGRSSTGEVLHELTLLLLRAVVATVVVRQNQVVKSKVRAQTRRHLGSR